MEIQKFVPLNDLVSVVIDYRGKTPLKLGGEWSDSGYRALSALNVKTRGLVAEDKIRCVNEELYRKWMKEEVKWGDILITSEAPFGQVLQWKSDEKIVLSQRLFALRLSDTCCSDYVYQYMASDFFYGELKSRATGSTVEGLRQPALMKCKIAFPPLPIQRRIASILSAYDSLIENNNKRIRLLEQMAENLYKEWFVRFRFPGYESAEFEGGIPKGWKVEKLGNVANICTGRCNREDAEIDGQYPLFDRSQETKKSSTWLLDCEAIIVPGEGTSFIPRYYKGKFNLHQRCYCVEPKNEHTGKFLFYMLMLNRAYFLSVATGATVPSLRLGNFTKMKFIYPSLNICIEFDTIVNNIFEEKNYLANQNEYLARQRDLLLPRLMSGKLEVKA